MRLILVSLLISSKLICSEITDTDNINKLNASTINTLLIFTSQEGLSSGDSIILQILQLTLICPFIICHLHIILRVVKN